MEICGRSPTSKLNVESTPAKILNRDGLSFAVRSYRRDVLFAPTSTGNALRLASQVFESPKHPMQDSGIRVSQDVRYAVTENCWIIHQGLLCLCVKEGLTTPPRRAVSLRYAYQLQVVTSVIVTDPLVPQARLKMTVIP